jgi:hypothetical protein
MAATVSAGQPSTALEHDLVMVLHELACSLLEKKTDGMLCVACLEQTRRLVEHETVGSA